jgi:hypothetical protein
MDPDEIEDGELLLTDVAADEQDIGGALEDEVTFGDEPEDDTAPDLPKRLRTEIKERDRELAILRKQVAEAADQRKPQPIEVGEEPTMETCDWDDDKFKAEWGAWKERSLRAELAPVQEDDLAVQAKKDVERLNTGLATLAYSDAEEATATAKAALTPQQEFSIATVAKDPATLIYALGKNPARLRQLTEETNPIRFIAAVARMEDSMRVGKKAVPNPENIPQGDAMPKSADKQLAKLEAEAERTGNRTALIAYKKKLAKA